MALTRATSTGWVQVEEISLSRATSTGWIQQSANRGATGDTLRVVFKTAAGADDNIWLTTGNQLHFTNSIGYYDPITAITV